MPTPPLRRYAMKDFLSLAPLITGLIMFPITCAISLVSGSMTGMITPAALIVLGAGLVCLRVRSDRRIRRLQHGQCAHCGYPLDTGGNSTFIRCPECGHWFDDPVE